MTSTGTKARTRSTGLTGLTNLSVLAPLRSDMVPSVEAISHVARLRKVLDALHASRQNLRESELLSVFPDVIGRFGIIHGFRYALVPPDSMPQGLPPSFGTWRLSLNVTFDGGWEPYMRVIQRDIGPLLDLLFCHSPTYPGSRAATFDAFCDWVRSNEVDAGLFYTNSSITCEDAGYLGRLEAMQRDGKTDLELARHRQPSAVERTRTMLVEAWKNPTRALALPFRTLKGLYRIAAYFPRNDRFGDPLGDEAVLRRFAQHVLGDPILFMREVEAKAAALPAAHPLKQAWEGAKQAFAEELEWLQWNTPPQVPKSAPDIVDPQLLQSHMLDDGRVTHGCMALLRVQDARDPKVVQAARQTLAGFAGLCGPVTKGGIGHLVALTYPGLQALGFSQDTLDTLPQDFLEGMEARAALLGDVRTNHPDRWTRPQLLNGGSGQRVDLKTVHVVVQLRIDDPSEKELLHPALLAAAKKLDGGGLYLQAVEALRSYRNANGDVVGHLGVADGVSQPSLSCQPQKGGTFHDDAVRSGELLLGRANARGDAAPSVQDPFLQDGSFLVVRKLRLFMDRLDKVAPPGQQGMKLLEKMFGRGAGGAPLHGLPANGKHPNDFAFDTQEASDACPYHSHIRRSNPRDGRPYTPRILRRGMSYGPESTKDRTTDRGVMFMAYCASITEQFETIQRWVAGGNSSGVGSAQGDPLLRVPQEGEKYTFRYVEKETVPASAPGVQPPDKFVVQRVEFDDQPLVQLQWGLYTFVPSLAALRSLDQFAVPRPPAAAAAAATAPAFDPEAADLEAVRSLVEDREKNALVWEWVRTRNPAAPQNRAYGKLLGTHDEVLAVMKDDGTSYSVHGYGVRKGLSIGPNLLGMDPNDAQRKQELPVRDAIARITESVAFATALTEVDKALAKILPIPSAPGDPARRPLDLVTFSDDVLAGVCTALFGVPDGTHLATGGRRPGRPEKPRCPGSLGSASRYIFGPHPRTEVVEEGQAHGDAVRKAVAAWYATRPSLANAPLSADIEKELQAQGVTADRIADNIAGTMLGFTPTVQGNFLRVMETWINEEKSLWDHQQVLFEHSPDKQLTLGQADTALRRRMLDAMRKHPVPELLWRSPVGSDRKADTTNTYRRVVLGIGSAMTNPKAPDELLFGRDCPAAEKPTVHGCPGYEMAMGVLLAMIGGVLKAGTLRPTGSPVLLVITDRE